jgi:hypothetical protein
MGVTNRDSSVLTQKRRGIAQNGYYQQWTAATMGGGRPQQGLKAPAVVSAAIVSEITLGCATCAASASPQTDPNLAQYPFNPSSGGAGRGY